MALRSFAVVGDALNFPARRYETVLRVTFAPLVLSLVFNMAAVFAYLSLANGRVITFADVANAEASWAQVVALAGGAAQSGLASGSPEFLAIYAATLVVNGILVSSFMAPLIRFAGVGEKPAPGLLRVPFGGDQIRFLLAGLFSFLLSALVVYAPLGAATFIIIGLVTTAVNTPYAHFPNPESLHTVDVISGADALAMRGEYWLYQYGYWAGASMVVAALLAIVFILHFRPRDRDRGAGVGFFWRSVGVIFGLALFFGVVYLLATNVTDAQGAKMPTEVVGLIMFSAAALLAAIFLNLRLYPYAGVAVNRRSLGFGGTFNVTRRFDIVRLGLAFLLLGLILAFVQLMLVWLGGGGAYVVVVYLATAAESFVRLASGGKGGGWVMPLFAWLWAAGGVFFTILWTAFTYGVSAGLWGRLYRESQQ